MIFFLFFLLQTIFFHIFAYFSQTIINQRYRNLKKQTMNPIEKYLQGSNEEAKKRALAWLTVFGIQSVVSLKPSDDFCHIIARHIEGERDINQIHQDTHDYYHKQHAHTSKLGKHEEADKVSVRIMELLEEPRCELSIEDFSRTHRHMFHGIYHDSGKLREHPASKKEWVLSNASVLYPKSETIRQYLEYLFAIEREIDYSKLSRAHKLRSYSSFIAKLFMINAFHYANTRTAFVYALQYLLSRGYTICNDTFYREAWYFRNAIVRACYTNMHQGIYPTTEYMEMFLSNLLHDEENELRNHRMMIKGE